MRLIAGYFTFDMQGDAMSVSFFKGGARFTGKPGTRQQQLREQLAQDRQNDRKTTKQRGYTSKGFKAKKK